jgi:hypothetical protein
VSPGLVSVSPGLVSVSPGLVSVSPGLVSVSPGLVSVSPGLVNNVIYITDVKKQGFKSPWYPAAFRKVKRTSEYYDQLQQFWLGPIFCIS